MYCRVPRVSSSSDCHSSSSKGLVPHQHLALTDNLAVKWTDLYFDSICTLSKTRIDPEYVKRVFKAWGLVVYSVKKAIGEATRLKRVYIGKAEAP